MTWYGIVVMGLNLIMMLVSAVLLVVTLIRAIMRRVRHQSHGMGMRKPFARALRFTAIMTAACRSALPGRFRGSGDRRRAIGVGQGSRF